MAKRLYGSYALALALSQAFGFFRAPGRQSPTRPATPHAIRHPSRFSSARASRTTSQPGQDTTIAELAVFAWQEFIALNWVAMDPGTTGIRGRADPDTDPNTGFLGIAPDSNGNFPCSCGRPTGTRMNCSRMASPPIRILTQILQRTSYDDPTHASDRRSDPELQSVQQSRRDEPDRLGPTCMHMLHRKCSHQAPGPSRAATGTRIAYEAKVNRAVFNYISGNGYSNPAAVLIITTGDPSHAAISKPETIRRL